MDIVYDVVENVHVFIPLIAVVSLVLIVFLCGIGRPQNPTDEYLSKIQEFDKANSKYSKVKQSKPIKPYKSVSPSSNPKLKETQPEQENHVGIRQRKSRPETVGIGVKSVKEEPEEAVPEGEWVTVNPKRKARSREAGNESDEFDTAYKKPAAEDWPVLQNHVKTPESPSKKVEKVDKKILAEPEVLEKKPAEILVEEVPKNEDILEIVEEKTEEIVADSPETPKNSPKKAKTDGGWSSPQANKRKNRKSKANEPAFIIEDPVFPSQSEETKEPDVEVITHDENDVVVVEISGENENENETAQNDENEFIDVERKKKKKKKASNKSNLKQEAKDSSREEEDEVDTVGGLDDPVVDEPPPPDDESGFTVKQKKKRPRRE